MCLSKTIKIPHIGTRYHILTENCSQNKVRHATSALQFRRQFSN
ncbi:hypothetical protein CAter282_4081 [Collimonas arenae]|uniref:Uncharacterized protein n=1 Tax=Collimonas arenae TaxID=279058 RepID=A0A127PVN1_9BURK|nr:hypothetical protein CAter10_4446 [Collimonas arenae]AMP11746.1 hypothetical protein CAter282_4081 [Collimonas arenae]